MIFASHFNQKSKYSIINPIHQNILLQQVLKEKFPNVFLTLFFFVFETNNIKNVT